MTGVEITAKRKRDYFKRFKCEVLTFNKGNKELIKKFISKKAGNTLESYIKDEDKAWAEDSDGETRVYLVKDGTDKLAMYFSVKCGVLVGTGPEHSLSDEENEFVQLIVKAKIDKDEKAL